MPETDLDADAAVLARFLASDPAQWPVLAPGLLGRIDQDRLRTIVTETRARVGEPFAVTSTDEGLVIAGPSGQAVAWVSVGANGIDGLLISPRRRPERRPRFDWQRWLIWPALLAALVASTWTAPERQAWIGAMLLVLTGYLNFEGLGAPAMYPWWYRRPLEGLAVVAAGSSLRWPGLDAGGPWWMVLGVAALALTTSILIHDRHHRWHAAPDRPLACFPLTGSWYVLQGGGARINHHYSVSRQRGAIDVVRTGWRGTRGRTGAGLDSYLAYGQELIAPCDGQVRAAVDGLPDQVPGRIRYGPIYGNHVIIDTGAEDVVLAHLRPGSLQVCAGDAVRAGQVIGQVGNSGNSTEPHLHLHIERSGTGLDLEVSGLTGVLCRGRMIRA